MVAKRILLGTTAILALAACNSSDDFILPAGGDPGPLGLVFETEVDVMSADREDGNTVFVSDERATITLNDLTYDVDGDIDSFSITLGLPDGSSVTLTEDAVQAPPLILTRLQPDS